MNIKRTNLHDFNPSDVLNAMNLPDDYQLSPVNIAEIFSINYENFNVMFSEKEIISRKKNKPADYFTVKYVSLKMSSIPVKSILYR